jgi:hypothetical protein
MKFKKINMIVEIVQKMTSIDWIIFAVTLVAYLILIVDILKNNGKSQNFFTWFLWGILDSILFVTSYKEKASDLAIIAGCILGSFLVSIFLLFVKKIKWTINETRILSLIIATVVIWLWSGSNLVGIIFSVTSEMLAGIPLMKSSWKTPGSKLTLVSYVIFIISYVLSIYVAPNWQIENILFPLAFLIYSILDTIPLVKKWIFK